MIEEWYTELSLGLEASVVCCAPASQALLITFVWNVQYKGNLTFNAYRVKTYGYKHWEYSILQTVVEQLMEEFATQ